MAALEQIVSKLFINRAELRLQLDKAASGRTVVFTNGVFDILHRGHLSYLARARDLGDALIVAVNADASVQRLKGPTRPLNKLADRMFLLAGLACVDYVTCFEEDTPVETIRIIRPSIHTKGADYEGKRIPEEDVVREGGGRVVFLPFVEGHSTTSLVTQIKNT
ncbi:MAG: D-glycero-beta-D-manno-heptose 1-phosphate adenylyltransferase [Spirochaetia bacterium]|nr:D-glycero-beta-D-manno-heptose 1-phosphate adenylyltransferase [Spirochaetia bacterium]